MDVELSDLLTCPRCGPTYGLVLLPYEVADRRVRAGVLGCANCRERWEIVEGVADLRVGGGSGSPPERDFEFDFEPESGPGSDSELGGGRAEPPAVRLAGLLGLAEARGTVLVAGPAGRHGAELSSLVEGVAVVRVVVGGEAVEVGVPAAEVTHVRVTRALPFRSGSLRGVALTGGSSALLEEGARVLGREGRLVLDPAPVGSGERLAGVGLEVVASEAGVVVAVRSR